VVVGSRGRNVGVFILVVGLMYRQTLCKLVGMKFSMITYNLRGDFWSPESSSAFADIIRKHDVDIVCFQELVSFHGNSDKARKKRDILAEIGKELGGSYGEIEFLPVQTTLHSLGNGFLYKKSNVFPAGKSFGKYFAPITERKTFEVWISKVMLRRRRVILSQKFKIKKMNIVLYNVHLDLYGNDLKKIQQLKYFFKFWNADRQKRNTFEVVTGDFNTWPSFKVFNLWRMFSMLRGFLKGQGFSDLTKNIDWTYALDMVEAEDAVKRGVVEKNLIDNIVSRIGHLYRQKLDHTWLRGNHELLSATRLDFSGSDHSPVLVEVNLLDEYNAEDK